MKRMTLSGFLVLLALTIPTIAGESDDIAKLVEQKSPALVTLKFLLKIKMSGMGDQESEEEITGFMIDPKGLVLCSNTAISGFSPLMKQFMGAMASELSATPTDIKVLIGDETEGLEAAIVARDTELDLAWVRIKKPGDKAYASIDLKSAAQAKLGEKLASIRRVGKQYDRVPVVHTFQLAGFAHKPRELLLADRQITGLGLPVYRLDGAVVGVSIVQLPESRDGGGNPFSMMSNMNEMGNSLGGTILPAEQVVKATERALASASEE